MKKISVLYFVVMIVIVLVSGACGANQNQVSDKPPVVASPTLVESVSVEPFPAGGGTAHVVCPDGKSISIWTPDYLDDNSGDAWKVGKSSHCDAEGAIFYMPQAFDLIITIDADGTPVPRVGDSYAKLMDHQGSQWKFSIWIEDFSMHEGRITVRYE